VSRLTVYVYGKCSTCRDALKWLHAHRVAYVEKPIKETPPTVPELKAMLAGQPGGLRRLFNTSGIEYRALGLAQKLPDMPTDEALRLLAGNGMLVKRPFVLGPGVTLVGFDEEKWTDTLAGK
jgi:arsenate reductase